MPSGLKTREKKEIMVNGKLENSKGGSLLLIKKIGLPDIPHLTLRPTNFFPPVSVEESIQYSFIFGSPIEDAVNKFSPKTEFSYLYSPLLN